MKILEIRDMQKAFGTLEVIRGLSLSVEEGEVVSIIGPSGSGKSTVLRCAALLERMDAGELSYLGEYAARTGPDGRSVYAPKKELRRMHRHFGLVFQNFNLFPHFSVLRNIIDAPMTVDRIGREEAEARATALLAKLGLEDKRDAYPYQLSGGQQQRVSIARALALEPRILFFDEPTSALDPELTGEVLRVIRDLARERMTMIIVTHEMQFARDLSDRILFMEGGEVRAEGTPEEIFDTGDSRVRDFIGRLG
ncbi:MAG: amino acid ABC transporter ATP-binding protein [Clostridia bacterium]|nr:amino acid ABC transporter ATP-binding protein [Clostridia bacterium]